MDGWNNLLPLRGILFEWIPPDQPWVEHARFYPYCVYLTYVKGPDFIRECKQRESNRDVELIWIILHP
jgi:hypothetical protein